MGQLGTMFDTILHFFFFTLKILFLDIERQCEIVSK